MTPNPTAAPRRAPWIPGVGVAGLALGVAWLIHLLVPTVPILTGCVVLGIVVAQIRPIRPAVDGPLAAGLTLSAKRLLRIGVVLLGLKLSLIDVAGLGWMTVVVVVAILGATFAVTWALGRWARLPGDQPLLLAAGFSICGASAIGAMSAVTRDRGRDAATPVALVTLCGTAAIAVLPPLASALGLTDLQFGAWTGASVHDVGQVVATAQTAGASALAIAIVVKLTRVVMLAPVVAITSLVIRRRGGDVGARPPIVPLFVVGFLAAVLVRTLVPVPGTVLEIADIVQTVLLGMALFGLGTGIRFEKLVATGGRAVAVGLASWIFIAVVSLVAVRALPLA
ncbi:YeiH family protein [Frigoribacterium faeni]|uniref:Membrane protein n=1 Tax=Frigoribacterium faeni TaxID=145483 RepID=A0A7W3JJU0_9MICO|nr:putative sulfate exporter family transporter [Frigoribacterium faeni]MBA8814148.1 putative integral membrane protein (TIGR00698 family) [Frigoribacterium faeni]GEK82740.1 membrane protein [Frigoribacterium faeni]